MSEEFEKFWEESRGEFLHAMPEQASKERAWRVWSAAWDARGKSEEDTANIWGLIPTGGKTKEATGTFHKTSRSWGCSIPTF